MLIYSDGFSCALNKDNKTVLINFLQATPILSKDAEVTGTEQVPVSSIIINIDMAAALKEALSQIISNSEKSNDE